MRPYENLENIRFNGNISIKMYFSLDKKLYSDIKINCCNACLQIIFR